MHEVALAEAIVDLVRDQARRDAFARVRSIRIAVGALSHVEPRALEFGFEAVSRGTVADGAKLVVERPSGEGWCTDCNATVQILANGAPCPRCGGHRWVLTAGDELRVVDLEVD